MNIVNKLENVLNDLSKLEDKYKTFEIILELKIKSGFKTEEIKTFLDNLSLYNVGSKVDKEGIRSIFVRSSEVNINTGLFWIKSGVLNKSKRFHNSAEKIESIKLQNRENLILSLNSKTLDLKEKYQFEIVFHPVLDVKELQEKFNSLCKHLEILNNVKYAESGGQFSFIYGMISCSKLQFEKLIKFNLIRSANLANMFQIPKVVC